MTDTLPEVVTAHRVAKHIGVPLVVALEVPIDALLAMSRYIEGTPRYREALQNLVWAWEQREGVEVAQKQARLLLSDASSGPTPAVIEEGGA